MSTLARGAEAAHEVQAAQAQERTIAAIVRALTRRRFRASNERELQDCIAQAFAFELLSENGPAFRREVRLSSADVVDFMVEDVAVEVKMQGSLAAVTRQLHRYAQHDDVRALVLVTSLQRLGNQPEQMNGKPLRVVNVGGAFR
jgi:hypothetical protein